MARRLSRHHTKPVLPTVLDVPSQGDKMLSQPFVDLGNAVLATAAYVEHHRQQDAQRAAAVEGELMRVGRFILLAVLFLALAVLWLVLKAQGVI